MSGPDPRAGTAGARPHVTVVVPCYDREATAPAAIASVLDQDYPAFDVVAVDDGSRDGTMAALRAIADPRLTVIPNPGPKGVCGARNAGAARATGNWIAFQDSDDLWRPGKLARQMARIEADGSDEGIVAVYCAMEIVETAEVDGAPPRRIGRVPDAGRFAFEGDIREGLAETSLVSTQTLVIRRDVFEAVGGFDPDFEALVDWELMLRVADEGRIAFVDEELVEQRMSGNSITRSTEKRLAAQERILEKHGHRLARYPHALARHHARIAGAHRDFARFRTALPHAAAASRAVPMSPRYHLATLYTALRAGLASIWHGR